MRSSVIAACSCGIEHLDHAAPFCAGCCPSRSRDRPSAREPRRAGARSRPGRPRRTRPAGAPPARRARSFERRAEHRDVAREPDHGAIDQLDRDRAELDDVLRRLHRLVEAAEMAGADRAPAEHGDSFSSIAVENASVPSEPTRICARLTIVAPGHQRVEIVAADPALHLGKARCDLVGLARAEREQVARQRTQRRMPRQVGEVGARPDRNAPCAPSASSASIASTFSRVLP